MAECEHDWRIVPNVILLTSPPRRQVTCIKCDKRTSVPSVQAGPVDPSDRTTWERATV